MLEKAVVVLGGLIGLAAGAAFYFAVGHLRLPGLLYAIVDLLGVLAGSILVAVMAGLVAIGVLVLACDRLFPPKNP